MTVCYFPRHDIDLGNDWLQLTGAGVGPEGIMDHDATWVTGDAVWYHQAYNEGMSPLLCL